MTARFKSLFDSSQRDEKFREQERARALATLRTCLPLPDVQLASGAAREAEQVVTGMERTEMCAKMVVGVSGRGRAGKGGGRGSPESGATRRPSAPSPSTQPLKKVSDPLSRDLTRPEGPQPNSREPEREDATAQDGAAQGDHRRQLAGPVSISGLGGGVAGPTDGRESGGIERDRGDDIGVDTHLRPGWWGGGSGGGG